MLTNIISSLSPKLAPLNHRVKIVCSGDLEIHCFQGSLVIVFTHLINNSLLHAFESDIEGEITITVEKEANHSVKFTYQDNGKGIPEADREKILDPFFTTKRAQGIIGLGLHVTYNNIYQKLNGTITLIKDLPVGAGFEIQLPTGKNPDTKKPLE